MDRSAQKHCPQCGRLATGNTTCFRDDRHCLYCNIWWHDCRGGLKLGMSAACRLCNEDLAPIRPSTPPPITPFLPSPPSFPRPTPLSFPWSSRPTPPSIYAQVETCRNCGSMTCPGAVHGNAGLCTKSRAVPFSEKRTGLVCDNCGYSVCRCVDDD